MIVLDASVLIAYLDETDAHHQRAEDLLLEAARVPLMASAITVAEVLVGPTRAGTAEETARTIAALEVRSAALGSEAAPPLARLRVDTRLPLPDCCVIHTAELMAAEVATFDHRLAAAARSRGLGVRR